MLIVAAFLSCHRPVSSPPTRRHFYCPIRIHRDLKPPSRPRRVGRRDSEVQPRLEARRRDRHARGGVGVRPARGDLRAERRLRSAPEKGEVEGDATGLEEVQAEAGRDEAVSEGHVIAGETHETVAGSATSSSTMGFEAYCPSEGRPPAVSSVLRGLHVSVDHIVAAAASPRPAHDPAE